MPTVRVRESCVVSHDGMPTPLRKGHPYDTSDPIVREFPWAFEADNDIEAATAQPGERRNVRRP